jgi:protein gp37
MNTTGIEWCDLSANPLKYRDKRTGEVVWGCVKKSPGCAHCYAEQLAKRYGRGGAFTKAEMEHLDPFLDEAELRKMLTAKTVGGVAVSGSRCFVGDMTDVFGEWVPDALLDRLFAVFALRPDVTWQVLTKRADRMAAYLDKNWMSNGGWSRCGVVAARCCEMNGESASEWPKYAHVANRTWPLRNVWLGVSVEDRKHGLPRIDVLRGIPAAVRFLSVEPLLEDLGPLDLAGISWVIVGGESGPGSRPLDVAWVRSIVGQCKAASVPVFVKQDSGPKSGMQGRIPDDIWQLKEFPCGN